LDSIFIPENFRRWVEQKGLCTTETHYLGHILFFQPTPFVQGGHIGLSPPARRKFAQGLDNTLIPNATITEAVQHQLALAKKWPCLDIHTSAEDLSTAYCFAHVGVFPVVNHTRDDNNGGEVTTHSLHAAISP
jgi:hypothetical protein